MIAWQVAAAALLVIVLILFAVLVMKFQTGFGDISEVFFKTSKYTFCCKMLGCQPWNVIDWSKLNPLCPTVCAGCACGESC
jgi:hypothetical protein